MTLQLDGFFDAICSTAIVRFREELQTRLAERPGHGRESEWDATLKSLPAITTGYSDLTRPAVTIGRPDELTMPRERFDALLKNLTPWRKGPWELFGVCIDTEWRSDYKWQRVLPHVTPLQGRSILDIGAGNGYYLLRMIGEGASLAIGVDPTLLYVYQFEAVKRYLGDVPAFVLPLPSEQLPPFGTFDTVFSLGVLYHRRSPMDHLSELMTFLRPGGELVLETLVVPGDEYTTLVPQDRYASMPNVWFLPSTGALEGWLRRAGFTDVRTVDVNRTSTAEQRATEWMTFQSLPDFLDPRNPDLTVEGLPAPRRAIAVATRP